MQTISSAESKPAQTSNKNKEETNVSNRIKATLTSLGLIIKLKCL